MSSAERQEWSRRVQRQMDEKLPEADEVVVLAGSRYRANLMPYLRERFRNVVVPMEGLKIGQQLRWLKNATSV
ncbi:hypothetical protein C8D95_10823 [Silicimonas algicola]|uniref:DUF6884 domain-containing protein n=2 Tax=Silicimonas algicola TaxID=1826607 RepID=A0A316G2V9_9RHOB|nr:hypothetical protein C8D95_10823 [Silicimonas algicola]